MSDAALTAVAFGLWYAFSGAAIVAIVTRPGALVSTTTAPPPRVATAVWVLIWLSWPYFLARWTANTLRA